MVTKEGHKKRSRVKTHPCIFTYTYIHKHVHTHKYIHARTDIHMHLHTYTYHTHVHIQHCSNMFFFSCCFLNEFSEGKSFLCMTRKWIPDFWFWARQWILKESSCVMVSGDFHECEGNSCVESVSGKLHCLNWIPCPCILQYEFCSRQRFPLSRDRRCDKISHYQ